MRHKKQLAFSLAEVLICLTVVAIMYAILTPVMGRFSPKEKKVLLKKSYLTLEKAIYKMINDDKAYPDIEQGFSNTTATAESGSYDKFCYYFIDSMNTLSETYGAGECVAKTTDGTEWKITPSLNATYIKKISIDVNGEKAPNCEYSASCKDPDQYSVLIRKDGKIKLEDTYVSNLLEHPLKNN